MKLTIIVEGQIASGKSRLLHGIESFLRDELDAGVRFVNFTNKLGEERVEWEIDSEAVKKFPINGSHDFETR